MLRYSMKENHDGRGAPIYRPKYIAVDQPQEDLIDQELWVFPAPLCPNILGLQGRPSPDSGTHFNALPGHNILFA